MRMNILITIFFKSRTVRQFLPCSSYPSLLFYTPTVLTRHKDTNSKCSLMFGSHIFHIHWTYIRTDRKTFMLCIALFFPMFNYQTVFFNTRKCSFSDVRDISFRVLICCRATTVYECSGKMYSSGWLCPFFEGQIGSIGILTFMLADSRIFCNIYCTCIIKISGFY